MLKILFILQLFLIKLTLSSEIDKQFITHLKEYKKASYFKTLYFEKYFKNIEDSILQGANVNILVDGKSPLEILLNLFIFASNYSERQLKIIILLIEKKAKLDFQYNNGTTPLITFCLKNIDVVKFMLEHGANPNFADNCNFSPLMRAQDIDIIKLLILHGADANKQYFIVQPKGDDYEKENLTALQIEIRNFVHNKNEKKLKILLHATDSISNDNKRSLIFQTIGDYKNNKKYSTFFFTLFDGNINKVINNLYKIFNEYLAECKEYQQFKKQYYANISETLLKSNVFNKDTFTLINNYCEISKIQWYFDYKI